MKVGTIGHKVIYAERATITRCADCKMPLMSAIEYHPFAACLMFRECKNDSMVRANLNAVVEYGQRKNQELINQS